MKSWERDFKKWEGEKGLL